MSKTVLVTGGSRSGKSLLAEDMAAGYGSPLCYIATATASDDEMKERISIHRSRRGSLWNSIEEPLDLKTTLISIDGQFTAILIDCVTLWLSNLYLLNHSCAYAIKNVIELAEILPQISTPVFLVSNEVGMGIVPESQMGREFRDLAGSANQILAAAANEVYVTFSGIPLKIKG